jgi:hypothetical protein
VDYVGARDDLGPYLVPDFVREVGEEGEGGKGGHLRVVSSAVGGRG